MPAVATNKTAKLFLVDGSGTPKVHEVYPMEGDFTWDKVRNLVEAMHRGSAMADGEGVMQGDRPLVGASFSYFQHDLRDLVKTDALLRWMDGDTTTTTAIASAGWTSTTSRPDGLKTLHLRYAPQGTATGDPFYTVADCMLITKKPEEGTPSVWSVEMKSTTSDTVVLDYYP